MENTEQNSTIEKGGIKTIVARHQYPTVVKLFFLVVLFFLIYSTITLPKYAALGRDLKKAENQLNNSNYQQAMIDLKKILSAEPAAEKAKILLALTYFSDNDPDNDTEAIVYLKGVDINNSDWKKLQKVMPAFYQTFFEEIK